MRNKYTHTKKEHNQIEKKGKKRLHIKCRPSACVWRRLCRFFRRRQVSPASCRVRVGVSVWACRVLFGVVLFCLCFFFCYRPLPSSTSFFFFFLTKKKLRLPTKKERTKFETPTAKNQKKPNRIRIVIIDTGQLYSINTTFPATRSPVFRTFVTGTPATPPFHPAPPTHPVAIFFFFCFCLPTPTPPTRQRRLTKVLGRPPTRRAVAMATATLSLVPRPLFFSLEPGCLLSQTRSPV